MAPVGYDAHVPRVSDAERERALAVLRRGLVDGRVSHDTFLQRMERVLAARWPADLHHALRDLPYGPHDRPEQASGRLTRAVGRLAAWRERLRRAWRAERLPQLLLPNPATSQLSIGRASGSGLRLNHVSVSRRHALLRGTGTGWLLRDLGSANGTWVNGRRVVDCVRVRPGDHVSFGAMSFRLTAPGGD